MKKITSLSRADLVIGLKNLVKKEKELTLEILDYLQEVSQRRLFLEMGYSSLFTFLTEEIGYCSGTAQLRLQTLKALNTVPENRERVLNDEVSLTTLAKTQTFINNENKALSHQSNSLLTQEDKKELFDAAKGVPANKVEKVLHDKKYEIDVRKAEGAGRPPPPPKPRIQKITLEVDGELGSIIETIKNLLSHSCPSSNLSEVLKKALPIAIKEIEISKGLRKRRDDIKCSDKKNEELQKSEIKNEQLKNSGVKKEKTKTLSSERDYKSSEALSSKQLKNNEISDGLSQDISSTSSLKSSDAKGTKFLKVKAAEKEMIRYRIKMITRHIPVTIKRAVWLRDVGQCQYLDAVTGKKCGSKFQLEYEHIRPWSFNGSHSVENLQLCCRAHNQYRWQRLNG